MKGPRASTDYQGSRHRVRRTNRNVCAVMQLCHLPWQREQAGPPETDGEELSRHMGLPTLKTKAQRSLETPPHSICSVNTTPDEPTESRLPCPLRPLTCLRPQLKLLTFRLSLGLTAA